VRRSSRSGGNQQRKRFTDADRLFSLTSVTARKHTPLEDNGLPIEVPENVVPNTVEKRKAVVEEFSE
jgi:hypothetical protein